ncbi:MAG: YdeI/OmpD-associated family protein [Bacteroidota bacterium]
MATKLHTEASHQISEYIESMPEWSRDICKKLRTIIHKADPQMNEDWKWGPNFNHNGMVCGIGAFKKHVSFVFFQGAQMKDAKKILQLGGANAHNRMMHIFNVKDIKEKVLMDYIKEAVQINMNGKAVGISSPAKVEIETPDDLQNLLEQNGLTEYFDMLAYTHRKEYILWITDAKKEETRIKRLDKTIEMLQKKVK